MILGATNPSDCYHYREQTSRLPEYDYYFDNISRQDTEVKTYNREKGVLIKTWVIVNLKLISIRKITLDSTTRDEYFSLNDNDDSISLKFKIGKCLYYTIGDENEGNFTDSKYFQHDGFLTNRHYQGKKTPS